MLQISKSLILSVCFLVLQLCVSALVHAKEQDRVTVELPLHPPRFVSLNSAGETENEDSPRSLEFRSLYLSVAQDSLSPTGFLIPKSICESKEELKQMLPADFHRRLWEENDRLERGENFYDDAVIERYWDLSSFLVEIWDLDESESPIRKELDESLDHQVFIEGSPDILLHLLIAQKSCVRDR